MSVGVGKERNSFLKVGSKPAKIRPQICPAAPLIIRPLFTFAAEQSASWQHWTPRARVTNSFPAEGPPKNYALAKSGPVFKKNLPEILPSSCR
jgi:hypothetical protein